MPDDECLLALVGFSDTELSPYWVHGNRMEDVKIKEEWLNKTIQRPEHFEKLFLTTPTASSSPWERMYEKTHRESGPPFAFGLSDFDATTASATDVFSKALNKEALEKLIRDFGTRAVTSAAREPEKKAIHAENDEVGSW